MDERLVTHYLFDIVLPGIWETIVILFFVVLFTTIFGMVIGSVLYMTKSVGLTPRPRVYACLSLAVNIIRAVPVIIFIVMMIPVTRAVMGTALGTPAAIFSISVMCTPFMSRVIEDRLTEVDGALVEAARSMGLSDFQVLTRCVIHSCVPALVSGVSFAAIIFLGAIAIAGAVGSGGIGAVAMNYGYRMFNPVITYSSIAILAAMVVAIQLFGRFLSRKLR